MEVQRGETLRFRLATPPPDEVTLRIGDGTGTITLRAALETSWRMSGPYGPLVIRARVPGRGDPSWAACTTPAPR